MGLTCRICIVFILLCSVVHGDEYSLNIDFELQKDEQKKILVKYADERRVFTMRWTLYINDVLTLLRSYNAHVAQNMLRLNGTNQSFRQPLLPRDGRGHNAAYLLVKFKEFDFQKNKAKFTLFLYNNETDIILEELKSR